VKEHAKHSPRLSHRPETLQILTNKNDRHESQLDAEET